MAGVQRRPAVTRYTAEQPRKASPAAVVAKAIVATVFAATAGLCAFRAASPDATPHDSLVPVTVLTLGYTVAGVLAAVLFVVAVLWTVKGFRFADNRLVAVVWPIVTVIFIIAAGASAVPQHYVEVGFVLLPALAASIVTMVAVAWAYNHDARR
ncbi:MAG TPA: hypothetical protein VK576_03535 [Thermoleophilia bacterium]|nr:hypothetical protein [Thermoleophilia bacterium]